MKITYTTNVCIFIRNVFFPKAGIALVGNKGVYKLIDTKGKKIGTKTWKFDGTWVSNMTPDIIGYKKGEKWGIAKIK